MDTPRDPEGEVAADPARPRRRLVGCAVVGLLLASGLLLWCRFGLPAHPKVPPEVRSQRVALVEMDMTKQEVRRLLGEPDERWLPAGRGTWGSLWAWLRGDEYWAYGESVIAFTDGRVGGMGS